MISHRYQCIFIHPIKTAGMSICEALGMEEKQNHGLAKHLKNNLDLKVWRSYFKFAFVRNPWDKIVSQYHYNGDKFAQKLLGKKVSFTDYVTQIIAQDLKYTTHQPQNLPYLVDDQGKLLVNFIGRFENLESDFALVCKILAIKNLKLPHINKSRHKHYSKYYNQQTKKIIGQKFADDIKFFNYQFKT